MRNFIISFHRCCCCSVWFFLYVFILSTSLEFQFTLCCCFAVSCLHSSALSRRTLPLPPLSWAVLSLFLSLSLHTDTTCSRTRTLAAVYRMRESATYLPLTVRRQALSLSLSPALIHFECVRSHFELFRHLRQIDFKVGGTFRI